MSVCQKVDMHRRFLKDVQRMCLAACLEAMIEERRFTYTDIFRRIAL